MKKRLRGQQVLFLLLLAGITCVMLFFGAQKKGFHEDEAYSYYSTNRSSGFYYPDREWVERETLLREFTYEKGEPLNFSGIRTVQSWDVHPPLYYYLLRLACAASPGVFSAWQGIAVNLAGFFVLAFGLYFLGKTLAGGRGNAGLLALLFYGLAPCAVSSVLFIRMYTWMSAFAVLLCLAHAKLHLLIRERRREGKKDRRFIVCCLLTGILSALGFLTQYYILILSAGLALPVLFSLLFPGKEKRKPMFREAFGYCLSVGGFYLAAAAYYPASLGHILKGYRGKEAVQAFADASNLGMRMGYFASLLKEQLFGGSAGLVLLLLFLLAAFAIRLRERTEEAGEEAWLRGSLLFACVFSFAVISKTALLLGPSSIRYILCICPAISALLASLVPAKGKTGDVLVPAVFFACIIALNVFRLSGQVLFRYPEEAEKVAIERETDGPAVVAFNPASPYNIWFLTSEVLDRDRLYFLDETNADALTDPEILSADSILLFLQDGEGRDASLALLSECGGEREAVLLHSEEMWSVYRLGPSAE